MAPRSHCTGPHILAPLGGQFTFKQSRTPGELLGRIRKDPAIDVLEVEENLLSALESLGP